RRPGRYPALSDPDHPPLDPDLVVEPGGPQLGQHRAVQEQGQEPAEEDIAEGQGGGPADRQPGHERGGGEPGRVPGEEPDSPHHAPRALRLRGRTLVVTFAPITRGANPLQRVVLSPSLTCFGCAWRQ